MSRKSLSNIGQLGEAVADQSYRREGGHCEDKFSIANGENTSGRVKCSSSSSLA